jgi:hypothetical protein
MVWKLHCCWPSSTSPSARHISKAKEQRNATQIDESHVLQRLHQCVLTPHFQFHLQVASVTDGHGERARYMDTCQTEARLQLPGHQRLSHRIAHLSLHLLVLSKLTSCVSMKCLGSEIAGHQGSGGSHILQHYLKFRGSSTWLPRSGSCSGHADTKTIRGRGVLSVWAKLPQKA